MNPLVGLILAIYHGLALAAFVLPCRLDWVLAGFGVFLLVGLGTTLGLHRKLTHRSFDLALIVAVWGWQAAPCVLYLPLKLWMHAQYAVNSVCHAGRLGFRSYDSPDESRNVWWVGLWALGEGWHNNHHAHPRSPMLGRGPWQIDVGGLVLRLLVKLGLARLPPAAAAQVPAMDAPASPR